VPAVGAGATGGFCWDAVTVQISGVLACFRNAFTGGRGLRIVEKLSSRWGTRTGEEGTTVWAEVPVCQAGMTRVGVSAAATEGG